MTAEDLRKVSGGVIGQLTPIEREVNLGAAATGDAHTGLYVPKGKCVIASYIKNPADDVTSSGSATLRLKVASTALGSAAHGKADIKGKAVADVQSSGVFCSAKSEVLVTVATAALTAGKVIVGVIYV